MECRLYGICSKLSAKCVFASFLSPKTVLNTVYSLALVNYHRLPFFSIIIFVLYLILLYTAQKKLSYYH